MAEKTMTFTLSVPELNTTVKRHLAVIAKRAVADDGRKAFEGGTLSSAEEPILADYYYNAFIELRTVSKYFTVTSSQQAITLVFPQNHNSQLDITLTMALKSFCISYAIYAWLNIVAPRIAAHYKNEYTQKMADVMELLFWKAAPQPTYDMSIPPTIQWPESTTINIGESAYVYYTVGSDGVDDLTATSSNIDNIKVTKDAANHRFSLYATGNGNATISVSSVAHPDINRSVTFAVATYDDIPPRLTYYQELGGEMVSLANMTSASLSTSAQRVYVHYDAGMQYDGTFPHQLVAVSSDTSVIEVVGGNSGYFTLITKDEGAATVTFTSPTYESFEFTFSLQVTEQQQQTVNPIVLGYYIGSQYYPTIGQTEATITDITQTVILDIDDSLSVPIGDSSDDNVAIYAVIGGREGSAMVISPVNAGSANITLTCAENPQWSFIFHVTVANEQTSIPNLSYKVGAAGTYNSFNPGIVSLETSETVTVTVDGGSGGTLTWGHTGDASISQDGNTFTITPGNDASVQSSVITFAYNTTDSTTVWMLQLTKAVAGVTPPTMKLKIGSGPYQIMPNSISLQTDENITIEPVGGSGGTLGESNTGAATVNVSGNVYTIHPESGTSVITFTYGNTIWALQVTYQSDPEHVPVVLGYLIGETYHSTEGQTQATITGITQSVTLDIDETWATVIGTSDDAEVAIFQRLGGRGGSALVISPVGVGTTDITLTCNENPEWEFVFHVTVAAIIDYPTISYTVGDSQVPAVNNGTAAITTGEDIHVSIGPCSGSTLTYRSNDTTKATVTAVTGTMFTIHPITGTTSVVFTYGERTWTFNVTYQAVQPTVATLNFYKFNAENITVDTTDATYHPVYVKPGYFVRLGVTADITSVSDNPSIATVVKSGDYYIQAIANGDTTIRLYSGGTLIHTLHVYVFTERVPNPCPTGCDNPEEITFNAPGESQIYVVANGTNHAGIKAVADPPSVARVTVGEGTNPNLTITAGAVYGVCTIIVQDPSYDSVTQEFEVTNSSNPVEPPMLMYVVGQESPENRPQMLPNTLTLTTSEQIYVNVSGGSGGTMAAVSADTSKATVQQVTGGYRITPISGSTTITFTYATATWVINLTYDNSNNS